MAFSFSNLARSFTNIFREAGGSSSQITNTNLKNFIVKHAGWSSDSEDYAPSENDLSEVKSAVETDSYIKAALDKISILVTRSGFKLESNNESALEYLKQRIAMMEFGTGIPFEILLDEIGRNLVIYSNCFVVKSRIDKIQGGLQAKPVLGKKAVGGYFIMDPTSVEIKRDANGTIKGYKLTGNEEKEFKAEDVIHFYVDRDASNNFGVPKIIAALDDVKALRKLEGNTLGVAYRNAYPLLQMKIGLPQPNFMATSTEITEAQNQVNKMPLDGILVTSERCELSSVNTANTIDLEPLMRYFEQRVFTALGMSEAMMGRGTTSDADAMEGLLTDLVKHYQHAIATFVMTGMFNEILLEGNFNPIFTEDDKVYFKFNEINLDTKVKIENHLLNQYQNNAITFEELRMGFGKKTEADESRLYTNMITTPSQIAVVQAKLAGGASGNNLTNGKMSSKNGNGQAKSVVAPTNQHGTTSAKIKESEDEQQWLANLQEKNLAKINLAKSANNDLELEKNERITSFRLIHSSMYNIYNRMRNNILREGNFSNILKKQYVQEFSSELDLKISEYARLGLQKSLLHESIELVQSKPAVSKKLSDQSHKQIERMIDDIASKVNNKESGIETCFDFMEYRLRFMCVYVLEKSFNYALLDGYRQQGIEKVKVRLSDGHSKMPSSIDIHGNIEIDIDKIPPYSPYCNCAIEEPEIKR